MSNSTLECLKMLVENEIWGGRFWRGWGRLETPWAATSFSGDEQASQAFQEAGLALFSTASIEEIVDTHGNEGLLCVIDEAIRRCQLEGTDEPAIS